MLADDAFGAPVALREIAAELIHGGIGIDADGKRVLTDVGAREDADGPLAEVVPFEPFEEVPGDVGRLDDLLHRDPALQADPAEIGAEGFESHNVVRLVGKIDTTVETGQKRARTANPAAPRCLLLDW